MTNTATIKTVITHAYNTVANTPIDPIMQRIGDIAKLFIIGILVVAIFNIAIAIWMIKRGKEK